MMFNVPLPGGTTGHAVGGALAAIVLGPEVATIAISIALVIQAFFFGDGGILAIGANCFNMAVVLPYIAYYIYRAIAGGSPVAGRRRSVGRCIGRLGRPDGGGFLRRGGIRPAAVAVPQPPMGRLYTRPIRFRWRSRPW